jgi:hypothetical protein
MQIMKRKLHIGTVVRELGITTLVKGDKNLEYIYFKNDDLQDLLSSYVNVYH